MRSFRTAPRHPAVVVAAVTMLVVVADSGASFRIVIHEDNPEEELTCKMISKLFLKKLEKWESGVSALPVDQLPDSLVRQSFTAAIHDKKVPTIKYYWQRQIFSDRAMPPPELASDHEVLDYVAEKPAAIGYVRGDVEAVPGVKFLEGCVQEQHTYRPDDVVDNTIDNRPARRRYGEPPRMVYVSPGRFEMGSAVTEKGRDEDETRHRVKVTRGFFITETEVTQEEWDDFAGSQPALFEKCGPRCPVERVNWFEALWFANRLSTLANLETCYELGGCKGTAGSGCADGETECRGDFVCSKVEFRGLDCAGFRLPSEAEWELAVRSSTTTAFVTGDELTAADARFDSNAKGTAAGPVAVRSFVANPGGLYEVHGNVSEWIWDEASRYPGNEVQDPLTRPRGGKTAPRGVRGGSWSEGAVACRSADRDWKDPRLRSASIGLRLVKTE